MGALPTKIDMLQPPATVTATSPILATVPRQSIQVDVAARENDTDPLAAEINLRSLIRRIRNCRCRLDHDLHRLPNRAHRENDCFLAYSHNVVHVLLNNRKVWFTDICAQPIGDGEVLFSHKPASRVKRLCRIIRILRLDRSEEHTS